LKPCFSVEECLRGFEVRRKNGEESLKLSVIEEEKRRRRSGRVQECKK
jgi:hypothetical protein